MFAAQSGAIEEVYKIYLKECKTWRIFVRWSRYHHGLSMTSMTNSSPLFEFWNRQMWYRRYHKSKQNTWFILRELDFKWCRCLLLPSYGRTFPVVRNANGQAGIHLDIKPDTCFLFISSGPEKFRATIGDNQQQFQIIYMFKFKG